MLIQVYFQGGWIMKDNRTNWGVIIGVVIATVAVLSAGAYLALRILKKKECLCCDEEFDDADICVLEDEDADDIAVLTVEEADAE